MNLGFQTTPVKNTVKCVLIKFLIKYMKMMDA